jgi:alpha-galactosidase/6-phospho-beta-glucosidase family protein
VYFSLKVGHSLLSFPVRFFLKDPEMMREAQKMMQDPSFQAYMKQLMEGQQMQQAITQTKQTLADPNKMKELEEKTMKAVAEGEKELGELEKKKTAAVQQRDVAVDMKESDKTDSKEKNEFIGKNDGVLEDIPDIPALNLN